MILRNIRPLLAQQFELRMDGLRIRRLRLNRHLPGSDLVSEHAHRSAQLLLYISGSGSQIVDDLAHAVKPGMLFFIPPQVQHSFVETRGRKPLCLALDVDWKGARAALRANLHTQELIAVRQALSGLARWRESAGVIEPREAAEVLQLVDIFFRALGLYARAAQPASSALVRVTRKALHHPAAHEKPLGALAAEIGYQPDYLNRLLKQHCGLTLGQLRADLRLQQAKSALAKNTPIAAVAEQTGFRDPNYFSRWFRQLTGSTPTAWQNAQAPRATR